MLNAPSIPRKNFTALTRLDQNRAQAQVSQQIAISLLYLTSSVLQIAAHLGVRCDTVHNVIIWGNHSGTQYVDPTHAHVITDQGKQDVCGAVKDDAWLQGEFLQVHTWSWFLAVYLLAVDIITYHCHADCSKERCICYCS